MQVQVFAMMKDYFDERFELDMNIKNIIDLSEKLIDINPKSKSLLPACRFAVNNEFIDQNYIFSDNDIIYIIPPSSGG